MRSCRAISQWATRHAPPRAAGARVMQARAGCRGALTRGGGQVVSIDGTELAGLSPLEVNKLVVGPQGSEALLKVLKRDSPDSEVCTVSLLREVGAAAARPAAFGVVRKG